MTWQDFTLSYWSSADHVYEFRTWYAGQGGHLVLRYITHINEDADTAGAYATAELGLISATLIIVTGTIWAKPVWGVWWTWDPKLTLTWLLWVFSSGFLMLRAYGPKGSQGARYGAVIALMGAVNAPIIYYATELWQTAHPALLVGPAAESGSLDSDMALGLLGSTFTFVVLAAYVLLERYSLRRLETDIDAIYQYVG